MTSVLIICARNMSVKIEVVSARSCLNWPGDKIHRPVQVFSWCTRITYLMFVSFRASGM
jgi:hypothetical protein